MRGFQLTEYCEYCRGILQHDMYEGYYYCPNCKKKFVDDWVLKQGGSKLRDASGMVKK